MLDKNVNLEGKNILVTGAAGFIGSNLVLELLKTVKLVNIVGIDSVNDYYDVKIKEWRLEELEKEAKAHKDSTWKFVKGNIADRSLIDSIFVEFKPAVVVNLAAQAGVINPDAYIEANIIGFYNILKLADTHMTMEKRVWNTLFTHLHHHFMEQIKKSLIQQMTRWIIQYYFMLLLRRAMSLWHMLIQNYVISHQLDLDFLQCMGQQAVQTWHILDLQTSLSKVKISRYSTMETANVTLHM